MYEYNKVIYWYSIISIFNIILSNYFQDINIHTFKKTFKLYFDLKKGISMYKPNSM